MMYIVREVTGWHSEPIGKFSNFREATEYAHKRADDLPDHCGNIFHFEVWEYPENRLGHLVLATWHKASI